MRFYFKDNLQIPTKTNPPQSYRISDIPQLQLKKPPLKETFPFNPHLQSTLQGKALLFEEIPFSQEEIQAHYENGYCTYVKGIDKNARNKYVCKRCGNENQQIFASFLCARCKEECTYCRNCMMMGRISECTPLITWNGTQLTQETSEIALRWSGTLSQGQQEASDRMVEIIEEQSELLIWAVCGAGKTEILFKGIEKALRQNQRVCIATPRTDVVLELAPRVQEVFPEIKVLPVYGGSEDRHHFSPLTISTTHQLFRFQDAFDLVILDEMDAFPYSVDKSLQYAVQKARKEHSTLIYLTATPDKAWQEKCKYKKIQFVTIPARFHQFPLPVPNLQWCGNWEKALNKDMLPAPLINWVQERVTQNKPMLLFVPKIHYMEKVKMLLQSIVNSLETVHAEDPERKEKVQKMRKKEVDLLITTTILERGVTFPNVDVAVLGAENQIFTESALVQIAGRVGRKKEFPDGMITFFHYGKTNSMVSARKQIMTSNKEARERGMLFR
ncbi:DEAD/DEAH box helicase [Niallia sp.]|uniref:DEAD/DEAH box helicase n=1 Tax=Niallia sp. TaxID=2837523 RepID=UPI00289C6E6D|nr:DEAD/DEAH box helicase [Niallia sp.]